MEQIFFSGKPSKLREFRFWAARVFAASLMLAFITLTGALLGFGWKIGMSLASLLGW